MTVQMPEQIPLEMPPGDADAMADLARRIGSAARCLAAVDARIAGPAAAAPGWLGDDASSAAAQVIGVDTLVRAAYDAVTDAAERLAAHAERLLETRSRVGALNHEQEEQFAEAWRRWAQVESLQLQVMSGGPDARMIVEEVERGEAGRRRRHAALLDEIEDDAAATARLLVDSSAAVGGRGRPGVATVVVAYLAAQLPGWGDRELGRRARGLAAGLTAGTPETKARAVSEATAFAGSRAFANALLAALGVEGVSYVLTDLGRGDTYAPDSAVARTLAAAFGAADVGDSTDSAVKSVLDAQYVHADDEFGTAGTVATGLAMVLSAGRCTPSGGVGTATIARWSRQFLRWEHDNREPIGRRSPSWAPEVGDPTGLTIGILAERADSGVSAALLDDPDIWDAALRRMYDDGGAALGEVVAQAGLEPGERGGRVVRLGLMAAGGGLAGEDPTAWTVNRQTLAGVAPGLGDAVGHHVDVAVAALQVGVDGHLRRSQADILAGLGYVTLDPGAAAAIEHALSGWAQVRPEVLAGTGPQEPLPAASVLGAYVAVQEFAQRTNHALDAMADQAEAQAKQSLEQYTFGLLAEAPGPTGVGLGVLVGGSSIVRHTDGTWTDRADRGLVFSRADAAALARRALPTEEASGTRRVVREARAGFDRTAAALPVRDAPISPEADLAAPVADLGIDFFDERGGHEHGWKLPRLRQPG